MGTRLILLVATGFALSALSAAQTTAKAGPRIRDGRPDLNGIWQALNEANYDIEAHAARPAMALRSGPYGPVPAVALPP